MVRSTGGFKILFPNPTRFDKKIKTDIIYISFIFYTHTVMPNKKSEHQNTEQPIVHESGAELLHKPEEFNKKSLTEELIETLNFDNDIKFEKEIEKIEKGAKEQKRQIEMLYGALNQRKEQNKTYIEQAKKIMQNTDKTLNELATIKALKKEEALN